MGDLADAGRFLLVTGLVLVAVGAGLLVGSRIPGVDRLGRLPGDFIVERGSMTLVIPIVSSIVISVVLTIALNLLMRR